MPHARNAEPEDKAHAVLALAEYCVRQDVGPDDVSESDLRFMNEAAEILCKDLNVLRRQAQAQSTDAWRKVLNSAHSMRCVTIDRDRKDEKRQCMFRCDGCGRQEKWCGLAIDLAGEQYGVKPADWLNADSSPLSVRWPGLFSDFHKGYQKDIGEPERCDMGRFYLGKTCHRKAKLCFIANTLVQETLYNAKHMVDEQYDNGDEFREDKLYTVDDEAPQEFIDRKDQLELCIADEQRGDMPDVMVDGGFWDQIDQHRLELTEPEIRSKATKTLQCTGGDALSTSEHEMSNDDEDEFVLSADDAEEEDEELSGIEDDGDGPRHVAPPKKRNRVIDDDDDDDDEQPPEQAVARPPKPRPTKGAAPQRRSRRVQQLSPKEAGGAQVAAEEPNDHRADVLIPLLGPERSAQPPTRRLGAPPSARAVATAMRIPREGQRPVLPSRRAVLLDMIKLQGELVVKDDSAASARVGAAVLTMQELMELVERGRVGQ